MGEFKIVNNEQVILEACESVGASATLHAGQPVIPVIHWSVLSQSL